MVRLRTEEHDNDLRRGLLDFQVRAIDKDKRTATFVAATENGVETIFGTEHLRMDGGDFRRYRKNPVVLDTHNRYVAGAVIGNADIKREGSELVADVRFATTARAEEAWTLVRDGFLRALSIGFGARNVQPVGEDETYTLGEREIAGPARIVTKWELYEISVVPVPADAAAVRRSFIDGDSEGLIETVQTLGRVLERFVHPGPGVEGTTMAEEKNTAGDPAGAGAGKPAAEPPSTGEPRQALRIAERSEKQVLHDEIRSLAGSNPDLRAVADRCILEGQTYEQARTALLAAHAKLSTPVGTPETTANDPPKNPAPEQETKRMAEWSGRELAAALGG